MERPGAVASRCHGVGRTRHFHVQGLIGQQSGRTADDGVGIIGLHAVQAQPSERHVDVRCAACNGRKAGATKVTRDIKTGIRLDRMGCARFDREQVVRSCITGCAG